MVRGICRANDLWSVSFAHEMSNESVSALRCAVNLFVCRRTCASRILHVNFYNRRTHRIAFLLVLTLKNRTKQTNGQMQHIQWTVIVCCMRFALLHSDRLSLVHDALCPVVCVFVDIQFSHFAQNDHSSSSLPECHSFHGCVVNQT